MLFSLRLSTSAILAMLPSQRFWITWSMVVSGETGSALEELKYATGHRLARITRVYDT